MSDTNRLLGERVKRTWIAVSVLALATLAAVVTVYASGSSGPKQPAVSAFAQGTCRTAAPDVLAIGRLVGRLGTGKEVAAKPLNEMADAQNRLDVIAKAAEPAYQPALRRLVTAVGLVRLRSQTRSYATSLGRDVASAYDGVLAVCTTRPAS